jgi:hypothetical protein
MIVSQVCRLAFWAAAAAKPLLAQEQTGPCEGGEQRLNDERFTDAQVAW